QARSSSALPSYLLHKSVKWTKSSRPSTPMHKGERMRYFFNNRPHAAVTVLATLLWMLGLAIGNNARAQDAVIEAQGAVPDPVTTSNPMLPTEELVLMLKPMTVTELTSEKDAWLALVI